MKTLFAMLALAVNSQPLPHHYQAPQDSFGSHRLVVYILADASQKETIEQATHDKAWEIADRDLLLVNLGDIEIETDRSLALTAAEKQAWRELWNLDLAESKFVLVGKDGGAKAFQRNELSWQLFFDLIDQMPMRRAEMEATYQAARAARRSS